jgi:hypothetical protein
VADEGNISMEHWCNDIDKKTEVLGLQKTSTKIQLGKLAIKQGTSCT